MQRDDQPPGSAVRPGEGGRRWAPPNRALPTPTRQDPAFLRPCGKLGHHEVLAAAHWPLWSLRGWRQLVTCHPGRGPVTRHRELGAQLVGSGAELAVPVHVVLGGELANGGHDGVQPPHGIPLDRGNLVLEGAQHLEIWGGGDGYGACTAASGGFKARRTEKAGRAAQAS